MPRSPPRPGSCRTAGAVGRSPCAQRQGRRAHRLVDRRRGRMDLVRGLHGRRALCAGARLLRRRHAQVRRGRRFRHRAGADVAVRRCAGGAGRRRPRARTPGDVIELGPGTGRLAADMLAALAARDALPARYRLLEVSPESARPPARASAARRARADVARGVDRRAAGAMARRRSSPTKCSTPCRRMSSFAATARGTNAASRSTAQRLVLVRSSAWPKGRCSTRRARAFPRDGDYASEINPAAQALVSSLAQRCEAGALFVIDYGFPAGRVLPSAAQHAAR